MSASVTAMERQPSLLDLVPAHIAATGPSWLDERRERALSTLHAVGFPQRKTERWQFSPIHKVIARGYVPAKQTAEGWTLGPLPAGVRAWSFAEAMAENPALLEAHLGTIAVAEYFAALNLARFADAVVLEIAPGAVVDAPIEIGHHALSGEVPAVCFPRALIVAGAGSRAQVIETYTTGGGDGLVVPVTEVAVGDDASLEHVRVTLGQESGFHVAALAARQGRQSRYLSRVITRGGPLSRVDVRATLAGEGGECELLGFYHATGHDHVDHPTLIEHAAPYATSREIYRGIADGRGSAVFDGTIVVRPGAIKTNAHQENRNLVLSDDASVNTKPHLEIDTDDVVCSHGATIGALDPEALSYLRIRGIGENQAKAMLTAAFVRQILDGVSGAAIRRRLAGELAPGLALGEGESGLFASFDEDWDAISR